MSLATILLNVFTSLDGHSCKVKLRSGVELCLRDGESGEGDILGSRSISTSIVVVGDLP